MKRVAIIAGPNGSGKTSFYYSKLAVQYDAFLNADEIAASLPPSVSENERNLLAAEAVERLRINAVEQGRDFAFETVFSRTDHWLAFIGSLRKAGYRITLFFICTDDPALNAHRIRTRVEQGGHAVPTAKVYSRFAGSIRTAIEAKPLVDELWLLDNSVPNRRHRLVARFLNGEPDVVEPALPEWARPFLF